MAGLTLIGACSRILSEAQQRGVILDVGHGVGSFSWRIAKPACRDLGFYPDTISTDLLRFCIHGPTYDMTTTMSKFMHLDMPLERVIEASTHALARAIGIDKRVGCLAPGMQADVTLLRQTEGEYDVVDVEGEVRVATQRLDRTMTIKRGRQYGSES